MRRTPSRDVSNLKLDRVGGTTLVDQIARHVEAAILEGALPPGGRLPSWRDLAAQLGVSRGTVKSAYEKLTDRGYLIAETSTGTRVADPLPRVSMRGGHMASDDADPPPDAFRPDPRRPLLPFQMGVPAQDAFPATLWARLHRRAVQVTASRTGYCDACGLPELRSALASHVAMARGVECSPEQVIVTTGSRAGLAIVLRAIDAIGKQAWVEDPGYPVARLALELVGASSVAVPVDDEGIDVDRGCALAPDAAMAIVTPGQQAPTGVTLTERRRRSLIDWAATTGA